MAQLTNEELKEKAMDIIDRSVALNNDLEEALVMQDSESNSDEAYAWWCAEERDLRKTITELDRALEEINKQIDWS